MAHLRPVPLRYVWSYGLYLLPRRAVLVLADRAAHRVFAIRPIADRHPRECPAHACDRRAGAQAPADHLHDRRSAGRHGGRSDRANNRLRRSHLPQSRPLRHRADHADHRRRRPALWRLHWRAALYDRAEPLLRDRAGLLVFLDWAVDGAYRRVCARRHSRPRRAAAPMTLEAPAAANGLVLETRGLCKSFGALTVADNIDFRLERG